MGFFGDVYDKYAGAINGIFKTDAQRQQQAFAKKGEKYAFLGENPYKAGWDSLIGQLNERAQGKNSLAEAQARSVAQEGMNQSMAMAHGRSAGAARAAGLGQAHITQGLEGSASQARLAEMAQAESALSNALANAGNAQYQRDASNQQAATGFINGAASQPSTFQQVMGAVGQLGAAYGAAGGGQQAPTGQAPRTAPAQAPVQPAAVATTPNPIAQGYAANDFTSTSGRTVNPDDAYLRQIQDYQNSRAYGPRY